MLNFEKNFCALIKDGFANIKKLLFTPVDSYERDTNREPNEVGQQLGKNWINLGV